MPSTATNMVVISAIAEMREAIREARAGGARIGFVPTMGALHDGHSSLVRRARQEADVVAMSIFVNPLQFGPGEDLARYPRPIEQDDAIASRDGVDILFRPDVSAMYRPLRTVGVTAGPLASLWEGELRPGHFDGVLTVVAKLFNIVTPDFAVFGRKDLQQTAVIRAMVRDLDMPISIVVAPIVREDDGLALSSRNRYLAGDDRNRALALSRALHAARNAFAAGERNGVALENAGREVLDGEPGVTTDYVAVIDPETFERSEVATSRSAAIVAARVGSTRLIDNAQLRDDEA
ncbi:MAG TPA: pantoate--beta-alanine ligase [Gemmatimonadaceae bacterium]|nr:pantoate--beta-alanine ligase [Gemmatimonadaceae bacterium]